MKPTWLIDASPAGRRPYHATDYGQYALAAGHLVHRISHHAAMAVADLPACENWPVVAHGSMGFVALADQAGHKPGGFLDETAFQPLTWLQEYRLAVLARDWTIVTYQSFLAERGRLQEEFGRDGILFVKPANGGKAINGTLLPPGRPLDDHHYSRFRRWAPLSLDFSLLVARPVKIDREWRFAIVGDEVAGASSYLIDGEIRIAEGAPQGAYELATKIAHFHWRPQTVFIADIGYADGAYGLIEVNPWGSSGTYAMNGADIVHAIAQLLCI